MARTTTDTERNDPAVSAAPGADPGTAGQGAARAAPDKPTKLSRSSWLAAARRTIREYKQDNLSDRAAGLTYYAVMSIFPAALVLVSLLGLLGNSSAKPLVNSLGKGAPSAVRHMLLTIVQSNHAAAGIMGIVGIVVGLWSASGYVAAFMRASNAIYDVPEGRPFWKTIPTRFGITAAVLLLLTASALIVVVTGGIASRVGSAIGAGPVAVTAWDIAKWPVLIVLVSLMFAIVYWASPNARQGFRWVSPGGLLAVIVWLVASGGFALYIANFGHYNKTYGSLGGIIIFLIWMWISNLAVLLGAEFNAELQRGRAIAAGVPPDREPFAELRDDRKLRREKRRALTS